MSDNRVAKWIHHLCVLSSASPDLFRCLIETCHKDLLVCIAEIFTNIGNLTISLEDTDIAFLRKNVNRVEELGNVLGAGQRTARDIIIQRRFLVQRGIQAALRALEYTT